MDEKLTIETASSSFKVANLIRCGKTLLELGAEPPNEDAGITWRSLYEGNILEELFASLQDPSMDEDDALTIFGALVDHYKHLPDSRQMILASVAISVSHTWGAEAVNKYPLVFVRAYDNDAGCGILFSIATGSLDSELHTKTEQDIAMLINSIRAAGASEVSDRQVGPAFYAAASDIDAIASGFASSYGGQDIARLRDSRGATPLHWASEFKRPKSRAIHRLLEWGADPLATDNAGLNPLRIALSGDMENVKRLLETNAYSADHVKNAINLTHREDRRAFLEAHLAKIRINESIFANDCLKPL